MKLSASILFCCLLKLSFAQNLVYNPSFEDFQDCPRDISFFHLNVKHWSIPNNGTTDYFNACSSTMGFDNFMGFQKAKSGKGYAGIHVYFKKNYREYIQGKLTETLQRGEQYEITFYVSLAEKSTHSIKAINLQFYNTKVVNFSKENLSKSVYKIPEIQYSEALDTSENWIELKATYTAEGFENYFIIGNFDKNTNLEKMRIPGSKGPSKSYYFIDDISIRPKHPKVLKQPEDISETPEIKHNQIYTFNHVLFDFDQAELLDHSIEELNQLYQYLSENPDLSIEIYGHTDAIGLDKRNKELSEQRAKAVADYLILQGLHVSRITYFGFGSSKPVLANDTKEGQQQNRRVEFKIIQE
ncbi:OmpA family protein [Psychroserpens sp. SPM9]|uniref:OmpA family protein n=1 Tax=Psychroserpens sp. SPM9 TaxID=2975598 RepID=UPI0021A66957|nr:OmpA family protein [Psychroserpens sp. SPM9]MDG5490979.1 OmpA family protein [Psychroserpens sp. SPM9]